MSIYLRADRAVFRFSGPDAHKLLNDVVTGHVPAQNDGVAAWWALLSPQGKILAEGLAGHAEEAIWVDVHQSVADDFFKRMKMYRLRAQVAIDDLRESHRVGYCAAVAAGIAHADQRGVVQLGWRVIAPVASAAAWEPDDAPYRAARVEAGIAELGPDYAPLEVFAHDVGMDLLGGIDFVKGCYVGQEVVSRMKHRGTARRRPAIVSGVDGKPGTPVIASGREAGVIGGMVDGSAVAIIRLDRVGDVDAVTVGDRPVRVSVPEWAAYGFGESSEPE
ncbi:MAG: folate-binding protein YgfZ [Devosia sp.]|nr:folate-binding protein YgfZ [Devosia sp.]